MGHTGHSQGISMKRLLATCFAFALIPHSHAAQNDGWAVVGRNPKNGRDGLWAKLRNAEQINKDSFKIKVRTDSGIEMDVKINCKNKDWGTDGEWRQVALNSGIGNLSMI